MSLFPLFSLFTLFSCFVFNSSVMIKLRDFGSRFWMPRLSFNIMDSILELLYLIFVLGFWSSVSTCLLPLFLYLTRFTRKDSSVLSSGSGSSKGMSNDSRALKTEAMEEKKEFLECVSKEKDGSDEKDYEKIVEDEAHEFLFNGFSKGTSNGSRASLTEAIEEKNEVLELLSEEKDGIDGKDINNEAHEFSFTFKFPTFEEFSKKPKDLSELLEFTEHIEPSEVSWDGSEVEGSVHVSHEDQREDFEDEECVVEHLMVDSEEKEEIYNSSEENLETSKVEFVYQSSGLDMDSVGSYNLHSPTSDVLDENKIPEMEEEEDFATFDEAKLQEDHDESVNSSPDSSMFSLASDNLHSPLFDLHFMSEGDFEDKKDEKEPINSDFLTENDFGAKLGNGDEKKLSTDTTNKLESLWEHQELIEQLQMEIKKVKAIGLPTIFEESESPPKFMEDLKPWKIEEVYQNSGGKMVDVHKFYKSYRERMRKFDIFNYQKMYTIGFLQLKDPPQPSPSSRFSSSDITTLFGQSFMTNKGRKNENDPTFKFIKELESDLEVVYVGQMCLSWEILHWQYKKALDVWESDPRGVRRFNDIAGEFQQFHVLMQRFIEDEPFQGPRIQSYVKARCVFRNLLQVPVIRADQLKSKKARSEVVDDITSDALVEILEESIRIFWRFVRADKYKRKAPVELQRPDDSQHYMDLQKDLHKKEKKLKEQLRNGNSILKKLRCREDEAEDHALYFFCEVDMRLVSRVLQMSRLTSDQLIWCHNKLSKVSFVNNKIHVEPSFLLFPC